VGRPDDDLGTSVGYADLTAAVSLVGELAGEELGQLAAMRYNAISASMACLSQPRMVPDSREKDTIRDKLSAL
jgi:hypothetical protein